MPTDSVCITVCHTPRHQHAIILHFSTSATTELPHPLNTTPATHDLHYTFTHLLPTQQWAFDFIDLPLDIPPLLTTIRSHQCIAVSDGSLKDHIGVAAFMLQSTIGGSEFCSVHQTPGIITTGNSYCCELSGLLAIVYLSNILCTTYDIQHGSILIACDNKTALKAFEPWFLPDPNDDSFDLLTSLHASLKHSPLTWTTQHVHGHCDRAGQLLSHLETLNIRMDHLANDYRTHCNSHPTNLPYTFPLYLEKWSIWHEGCKVFSPTFSTLYELVTLPAIRSYWTSSHHRQPVPHLSPPAFDAIDWPATASFMQSLSPGRHRWCTKHASEHCGVGLTVLHWNYQRDPNCP